MERKTQTSEIVRYLRQHPKSGITQKIAQEQFGAERLGSMIHRLRHKRGMNIETILEVKKTRYDTTTEIARYVLHES